MGSKEVDRLIDYSYDTWRKLDYSTEYMYFPESVMRIVRKVVAAERRATQKTSEAKK